MTGTTRSAWPSRRSALLNIKHTVSAPWERSRSSCASNTRTSSASMTSFAHQPLTRWRTCILKHHHLSPAFLITRLWEKCSVNNLRFYEGTLFVHNNNDNQKMTPHSMLAFSCPWSFWWLVLHTGFVLELGCSLVFHYIKATCSVVCSGSCFHNALIVGLQCVVKLGLLLLLNDISVILFTETLTD